MREEPIDLDDCEDAEPRSRGSRKQTKRNQAWIIAACVGGSLLVLCVVGVAIAFAFRSKDRDNDDGGGGYVQTDRGKETSNGGGVKPEKSTNVSGGTEKIDLDTLSVQYQTDSVGADAKYKGKRLQLSIKVLSTGTSWVAAKTVLEMPRAGVTSIRGASRNAQQAAFDFQAMPPNLIFNVTDAASVRAADINHDVTIEGVCEGLDARSPRAKLTFKGCKIVR